MPSINEYREAQIIKRRGDPYSTQFVVGSHEETQAICVGGRKNDL